MKTFNSDSLISKGEKERTRIRTIAQDLQRVDTALVGWPVEVRWVEQGPAPSWTDFKSITINSDMVLEKGLSSVFESESLVTINAVNYHEVSHLLFTPGPATKIGMDISSRRLRAEWNMLEDQRIEALFLSRYRGTMPYFQNMILKYMLSQKEFGMTWPLLYGRHYLPDEVRNKVRAEFVKVSGEELCREFENCIDTYMNLSFDSSQYRKISDVVLEYKRLLARLADKAPQDPHNHAEVRAGYSRANPDGGETNQAKEEAKARGLIKSGEDDPNKSEEPTHSDNESKGESKGSDENQSGEAEDKGHDDSGNGEGEGESDTAKDGSATGAGTGDGTDLSEQIKDAANKAIEEAMNSNSVTSDLNRQRQILTRSHLGKMVETENLAGRFTDDKRRPFTNRPHHPIDGMDSLVCKRVSNEFGQLVADADPGYVTHRSAGRVSMQRAMQHVDYDTVFDQWQEGNTSVSEIEIVVLVDVSSSMSPQIDDVSRACWTFGRGIETASSNMSVTLITYSGTYQVIKDSGESFIPGAYPVLYANGGTNPISALDAAARVFYHSQKKHAVLVTLTDGVWVEALKAERRIERFNQAGITTGLAFMLPGDDVMTSIINSQLQGQDRTHKCQVYKEIHTGSDFVEFSKGLVKVAMDK